MSDIVRFSVSVEDDLLEEFDRYCQEEKFATRSEAVRQLIRDTLTRRAWASQSHDAAGTLTLVYDHHRPQLRDRLLETQHGPHRLDRVHAARPLGARPLPGGDRAPRSGGKTPGDRLGTEGPEGDLQGRAGDGQRPRQKGRRVTVYRPPGTGSFFGPFDCRVTTMRP